MNRSCLLPVLLLPLLGCSALRQRSDFLYLEKAETARPVCSLFHSTNGAALVTTADVYVVVEPASSGRTLLLGPPLVPFIPIQAFSDKTAPRLQIQVLPRTEKRIELLPNELSVQYDGQMVEFDSASYRKKGAKNNEVVTGFLEKEQLKTPLQIDGASDFYFEELSEMPTPATIQVSLALRVANTRHEVRLKFSRDSNTKYFPLLLPDGDGPSTCETELPTLGKRRLFF